MKTFQEFKSVTLENKKEAKFGVGDKVTINKPRDKFYGESGVVMKIKSRFTSFMYRVKPANHDASFLYSEKDLKPL